MKHSSHLAGDEPGLLQAVLVEPDNDLPRLVYADWLDEYSDAEWAKFIRLQCENSRLANEAHLLLLQHGAEWTSPLTNLGVLNCRFHRGFADDIRIAAAEFVHCHQELAALTPIAHLHFRHASDADLIRLANLPLLGRL